jgi:predicted kinase
MSARAAIRAHVAASSALQARNGAIARLHAEARGYLALSGALLVRGSPRLIAVGGLSGSGKSTLASALAPIFTPLPGARVIRSDVTRKWMMNLRPEIRLPPAAYTDPISAKVYSIIREQAAAALGGGYTAIADATFIDPGEREAIAGLARQAGVAFTGLWLTAPGELLASRIAHRHGDSSDADQAVLLRQLEAGTGAIGWHMIDASRDVAASVAAAQAAMSL